MKKFLATTVIAIVLATTSAFATDENKININIRNTFYGEFTDVKDVHWILRDDYVKATFTRKGKINDVFYDLKGNRIGSSENVTLQDLPEAALEKVEKKNPGAKITEAIHFTNSQDDAYYVTVETDTHRLVYKLTGNSSVSLFKKDPLVDLEQ